MRLPFRQGIVSHQAGSFLAINPAGNVDIRAINRPVTVTIAHQSSNYTHTEDNTVPSAWTGPFDPSTDYWLYWDFDLLTFTRSFGNTHLEPIVQQIEPSSTGIDSSGVPHLTVGRHWYNTTTHQHMVWQGTHWTEVIRVFAARVINGNTILPYSATSGSFTGTQIGDNTSVRSGRVLVDESSMPIRRDSGTFFTTEDQFFSNSSRADGVRLESSVARAQFPYDNAIAEYTVVAWKDEGKAQVAQYDDTSSTVVGILTEPVSINEVGAVIIQGVVTNPSWNWTTGSPGIPVGSPLWIDNGYLTPIDPHTVNSATYPVGRVPVARILSSDTVIFEQGLGGKGETGPVGSVDNFPPATVSELGAVTLTTPSSIPELAIVPSDMDPRLFDARPPLPHTHPANEVTFVPAAGLSSLNVDGALVELGTQKLDKSGGTMTGALTLPGSPINPLHATTKEYVDGLVSGLIWLTPVCLTNLVSDIVAIPPTNPNKSDAYIVPTGAVGDWSSITAGHVVIWDGSVWIDRGTVTDINPTAARFGVTMTTSTIASGSFAGRDNDIALFDDTGTLVGFETPILNNAVYVCNAVSLNAYNQYAFSGTDWILFGGSQSVTADGTSTVQTGNVLSVKQFADGGINDVKFWQGLEPSDLNTVYAPINHYHTIESLTDTDTVTSPPQNGDALVYNSATSKWEPNSVTAGSPYPVTTHVTPTIVLDVTNEYHQVEVFNTPINVQVPSPTAPINFKDRITLTITQNTVLYPINISWDDAVTSIIWKNNEKPSAIGTSPGAAKETIVIELWENKLGGGWLGKFDVYYEPQLLTVTTIPGSEYILDAYLLIPITGSTSGVPGSVSVTGTYTSLLWEEIAHSWDQGSTWVSGPSGEFFMDDPTVLVPNIGSTNGPGGLWYQLRLTAFAPTGDVSSVMTIESIGY